MHAPVFADLDAGRDHDFPGMAVRIGEITAIAAVICRPRPPQQGGGYAGPPSGPQGWQQPPAGPQWPRSGPQAPELDDALRPPTIDPVYTGAKPPPGVRKFVVWP